MCNHYARFHKGTPPRDEILDVLLRLPRKPWLRKRMNEPVRYSGDLEGKGVRGQAQVGGPLRG